MTTSIEERLTAIEQRNQRVEGDKAWETSAYRMVTILIMTYLIATLALWIIKVDKPFLGAIIPTLGFFLSTATLPFLKRRWLARHREKI
jgi:hypothetical protein